MREVRNMVRSTPVTPTSVAKILRSPTVTTDPGIVFSATNSTLKYPVVINPAI